MSERKTSISIARQFSRFPAGRFKEDGPFSGQLFREKFLLPALQADQKFIVDLDGTAGYGSSFLEEAFGGLVRAGWPISTILDKIEFKSEDSSLIEEVRSYITNA